MKSAILLHSARRIFALLALSALLTTAVRAGTIIALDFNGEGDGSPAMEAFRSPETVRATAEVKTEGSIDLFRGSPSGAAVLDVAPGTAGERWHAGLRTPRIAIANTETALAKLALSFDLQPSAARPVRVRLASFDADGKRSGSLEKSVFPPVAGSFYRHTIELAHMTAGEGRFDPAAPFFQLSWEIGNEGPQPWPEAASQAMRVDNVSLAGPSFYISAAGSDKADGRTETTAFQTIKRALAVAQPGDTLLVLDGLYALGDGVKIAKSGAPAKWITLKNAPGAKPRLEFTGWSGLALGAGAAFFEINGLEIAGGARDLPLAAAQEDGRAEKPNAKFNGTAISIEGRTIDETGKTAKEELPHRDRADRPHHIRLIGCHIHDAPGAGIAALLTDYLTIEGNTVTDCAARSRYAHSGITMYWAWNFDASLEHRNFIRNNVTARNRTMVPWQPRWVDDPAKAFVSDGNGIIVDDFIQHQPGGPGEPNAGRTLVQNNLSHHNGGGGVHIFASDRVDVVNNTTFANCQTDIIDYGEIDTSWSKDCRVLNNVAVAGPGKTVHRNRSRQNKLEPSNRWEANVLFADGTKKVTDFSALDTWADPLFAAPAPDAPSAGFSLLAESPAREIGIASPLVCAVDLLGVPRPLASGIAAGALQAPGAKMAASNAGRKAVSDEPYIAPEAVAIVPAGLPIAPAPKAEAGRAAIVEVEGKPAVRVQSLAKSPSIWNVGVVKKFLEPIEKGATCLAVVRARAVASEEPDGKGRVAFVVRGKDYKKNALWKQVDLTAEWRTLYYPFQAEEAVPAGEGNFNLFCSMLQQTIEIADVRLYRYPAGTPMWDLPHMAFSYAGRALDAPWRQEAAARIAKLRQGPLAIIVTDAADRPVSGARVSVAMKRHAFGFGSAITAQQIAAQTPNGEKYRALVDELFSRVVFENDTKPHAWPAAETGRGQQREWVEATMRWCAERGISMRGHYLAWCYLEPWSQKLKDSGQSALIVPRIAGHAGLMLGLERGQFIEWDALNHPVPFSPGSALADFLGADTYVNLMRTFRALTKTPLIVNEELIHEDRIAPFEQVLQSLAAADAAPDGIGIMGHYAPAYEAGIEEIWATFERLAPYVKTLRITEYDFPAIDDALHADHLRDLLTLAFSHPKMTGFLMWGFWEKAHWKPEAALLKGDWTERPAVQVWRDLVKGKWWTNETLASDARGVATTPAFFGAYEVTVEKDGAKQTQMFDHLSGGKTLAIKLAGPK